MPYCQDRTPRAQFLPVYSHTSTKESALRPQLIRGASGVAHKQSSFLHALLTGRYSKARSEHKSQKLQLDRMEGNQPMTSSLPIEKLRLP